jgi:cell division protein FtsW
MVKKILKSYDYSLIVTIVLLSLFGLVMIYSASMVSSLQRYGVDSDYFFQKQKLFLSISAIVFTLAALFPYKALQSNKVLIPMVFFSLLGLGAIFIIGHVAGNAQSWIKIGSFSIQPSEFVKLCVIIYLAAVYAKKQSYINEFNRGVAPPLAYLALITILIVAQPDYGTAGIIVLIALTIIFCSGMNLKNIFRLIAIGTILFAPIGLVMKNEIFSDERMSRLTSVANPFADEKDAGYHLVNSYLAIGSGGVNGLGLGKSIQKLGYLPESHTDFIMAVIAEELGIWGVVFVLLSLAFIVLKGILIGIKCKDPFGSLLAIGISSMIGIQAGINLAGISGLMPITGVPLPFVSYGGSSFLQLSIAMGILVNVSMFVTYESNYKSKSIKAENTNKSKTVNRNSIPFRN